MFIAHSGKQHDMETLQMAVDTPPSECRERFFEELYENAFPPFARFAGKMGASFQDAKDVFQDAIVIYYEKRQSPDFSLRSTPEAYVLGIARNLWWKKFNQNRLNLSTEDLCEDFSVPEDYFPDRKELSLLTFLERSGRKCLDLLHRFYFEKASLKNIAANLGYRTEHSAAVQKYKCIGKLRDVIKERSIHYEDFHF
jgi:DNA-directed RNA polymerase specialized sigma24 family protein